MKELKQVKDLYTKEEVQNAISLLSDLELETDQLYNVIADLYLLLAKY